jgi:type I restriction enzyme S subunit
VKAGWDVKRLEEVCQVKPTKRTALQTIEYSDEVSFVPMADLGELQKNFEPQQAKPLGEVYQNYTYFGENDILVAKITPCFENGKLGIARGLKNGIGFGSSEFVPIRPSALILPEYVFYFMLQDEFRRIGAKIMTGAVGHRRVPEVYFQQVPIPLAPLEEQKRIVAILDEAFEGLTRARAHTETNLQNAQVLFECSVDEVLRSDRAGWKSGALVDLVGAVSTGPFGSVLHKSDYVEGETPIVNPAHIVGGEIVPDPRKTITEEAKQRLKSYQLRAGDIVIGRRGEMGRCAVVGEKEDGWLCGTGSFFIRPSGSADPFFVAHLLRSKTYVQKLESISGGATMPNISNSALAKLEIQLPSLIQQREYLLIIDELRRQLNELKFHYRAKLADLDALRQSLLQKAFAGELT